MRSLGFSEQSISRTLFTCIFEFPKESKYMNDYIIDEGEDEKEAIKTITQSIQNRIAEKRKLN